jgi:hypothetical protein
MRLKPAPTFPLRRRALLAAPLVLAIAPARSQASTPAHSLQAVERANVLLRRFATASLIDVPAPPSFTVPDRRPRHVFHLGQEAWIAADALRRLHGLTSVPVPPAPSAEVSPLDVITLVGRLEEMLAELNRHFALSSTAETPPLRDGINPTHVYQALRQTNTTLRALGVGMPTPNNVYAVAERAREEAQAISTRLMPNAQATPIAALPDRMPVHAFEAGRACAEALVVVTAARRIEVPGGIRPLDLPTGRPIVPADVLEMARSVLADLGSVKSVLGLGAVGTPGVATGRTPADVEAVFRTSIALFQEVRS